MDEKWLNFAGLLHICVYKREHTGCPYNQIRKMDQMEKLEKLLTISDGEAKQMQHNCAHLRNKCHQVMPFSLQNLSLSNKANRAKMNICI